MTIGKIGVQMMMLKGKVEELGAYETLKKVREIGYRSIEISQIPMTAENISEIRRASVDFDIEIAAITGVLEPKLEGMEMETLSTDFDKIVNDCKTLDCNYIRMGMLPFTAMGDKKKTMDFIRKSEEMAERLEEHEIELYYHNHHFEFQQFDGKSLLEIMRDSTSRLGFELDIHWIHRGGEDPVNVIKKFENRISLLHLKDYRIGSIDNAAIQSGGRENFMKAFTNVVEFAEIGEGTLDIKSVIEAGIESGVKHFLVEQDSLYGRDPFICLQTSADNLKELGYAGWF